MSASLDNMTNTTKIKRIRIARLFFQVLTWDPSLSTAGTSWLSLTAVRPTLIQISLPAGTCDVLGGYITYYCGDVFYLLLPAGGSTMFSSNYDLSGTFINATDVVSILAGNTNINVGQSARGFVSSEGMR